MEREQRRNKIEHCNDALYYYYLTKSVFVKDKVPRQTLMQCVESVILVTR